MIRLPSIRAKLLALFVLVAAMPIAAVSLTSYFNSVRAIEDMVGNEVSALASSVGDELDRKIQRRLHDRIIWVNQPVQTFLRSYPSGSIHDVRVSHGQLMRYLPELFEQFGSYYDEMLLADPGGEVLFKYHRSEGVELAWALGSPVATPQRLAEPGPQAAFPDSSTAMSLGERRRLATRATTPGRPAPITPIDIQEGASEGDREAATRGMGLAAGEWLVIADLPYEDGSRAVRLVHPVFDNQDPEKRIGIVVTHLRPDYVFREGIFGRRFGDSGELLLMDRRSGEILSHTQAKLEGTRLLEADPLLAAEVREEAYGGVDGIQWRKIPGESGVRITGAVSLTAAPWSVVATALPREFESEARSAGLINLVVALLAMLAGFVVLLYSSGRISRSIKLVTRGAREIAEGNLEHEIHVTSHDEIEELAENFNGMTLSLRENIELRERAARELAALNRTLEDRVKERTRDLETLNTSLEQANFELKELDRLKTQFLANVSHEFKTPLTSIQAFSEILLDEREEEDARVEEPGEGARFLSIIHSESQRLGRLIRNLLSLSQIESGRITWHETTFAIGEPMDLAMDGLLPLFQEKEISLERTLDCAQAPVIGDRDRIQEVASNLLDNAVKFSDYQSRIEISCIRVGNNGQAVVQVSIRDHGVGIPREKLDTIFDRFSQVDPSDTREKGGTGLGLAICKEIVEHHGGRIWVESEHGQGACFYFTLPLAGNGHGADSGHGAGNGHGADSGHGANSGHNDGGDLG